MSDNINNEDITVVMYSLGVSYIEAIDLIKKGLNVNYIKTGFKNEINSELTDLTSKYKENIDSILKDSKL
jgi:hypothetical protein